MVATYLSDEPSDAALWMLGEKTERGTLPGMAQRTIQRCAKSASWMRLAQSDGGVVRYPGATISEPTFARSIGIQGVWFNWYCAQQRAKGLPVPATLSDVPKADMKAAKAQIAELGANPLSEHAAHDSPHKLHEQKRRSHRAAWRVYRTRQFTWADHAR